MANHMATIENHYTYILFMAAMTLGYILLRISKYGSHADLEAMVLVETIL